MRSRLLKTEQKLVNSKTKQQQKIKQTFHVFFFLPGTSDKKQIIVNGKCEKVYNGQELLHCRFYSTWKYSILFNTLNTADNCRKKKVPPKKGNVLLWLTSRPLLSRLHTVVILTCLHKTVYYLLSCAPFKEDCLSEKSEQFKIYDLKYILIKYLQ